MPVNLYDIRKGLLDFGRDPKEYKKLKIVSLETVPMAGVKTITYKMVTAGETDKYLTYIQFFNVEFSYEKKAGWVATKMDTAKGKRIIYYKQPSIRKNNVKIKCGCSDFRFTFEKELYDEGGLIGNWRRYKRVPGSTRPPRNPNSDLGMCKHVYSALFFLKQSGYISE